MKDRGRFHIESTLSLSRKRKRGLGKGLCDSTTPESLDIKGVYDKRI